MRRPMKLGTTIIALVALISLIDTARRVLPSSQPDREALTPSPSITSRIPSSKKAFITPSSSSSSSKPPSSPLIERVQTRRVYIHFGNANGRFANQLKGIVHAIHLAHEILLHHGDASLLQIWVVVPSPFSRIEQESSFTELFAMKLPQKLVGRLFIVNERDVKRDEGKRIIDSRTQFNRPGIPNKLPAATRQALGGPPVTTTNEVNLGSDRRFSLLIDKTYSAIVATPANSSLQLVYFELVYYDGVVNATEVWSWMHLPAKLSSLAERKQTTHQQQSFVVGIHARSLEGSCPDRVRRLWKRRKASLILLSSQKTANDSTLIEPIMARSLVAHQERMCDIPPNAHSIAEFWAPALPATAAGNKVGLFVMGDSKTTVSRVRQAFHTLGYHTATAPEIYDNVKGIDNVILDLWTAVFQVDLFVGNSASTLSAAICFLRRAHGRVRHVRDCYGCSHIILTDAV